MVPNYKVILVIERVHIARSIGALNITIYSKSKVTLTLLRIISYVETNNRLLHNSDLFKAN